MVDPVVSMDDILSDKEPEKPAAVEVSKEPAAKVETPLEIPKLGDKPLPEEPKVERVKPSRKEWRDREQVAQGRGRDP